MLVRNNDKVVVCLKSYEIQKVKEQLESVGCQIKEDKVYAPIGGMWRSNFLETLFTLTLEDGSKPVQFQVASPWNFRDFYSWTINGVRYRTVLDGFHRKGFHGSL